MRATREKEEDARARADDDSCDGHIELHLRLAEVVVLLPSWLCAKHPVSGWRQGMQQRADVGVAHLGKVSDLQIFNSLVARGGVRAAARSLAQIIAALWPDNATL